MTVKERLHRVVEEMTDAEAEATLRRIDMLRNDPCVRFLDAAPVDDEPITVEDEQAFVDVDADRAAAVPTSSFGDAPWAIRFESRAEKDIDRLDPQITVTACADRRQVLDDLIGHFDLRKVLSPMTGLTARLATRRASQALRRGRLGHPVRRRRPRRVTRVLRQTPPQLGHLSVQFDDPTTQLLDHGRLLNHQHGVRQLSNSRIRFRRSWKRRSCSEVMTRRPAAAVPL